MTPKTQQSRYRRLAQLQAEHHRRALKVATAVFATMGGDFFRSLVEHLAAALDVDCAYVAEVKRTLHGKSKTIAIYRDKNIDEGLEQELAGSALFQVVEDGAVALSAHAARIFPLDPLLNGIDAEGFVGIRLSDATGQVLGVLAIVTSQRLADVSLAKSVLQTFAVRAAAELERKRSFEVLRESEERYRAFISSSLDAMWRIEFEKPISLALSEEEQVEAIFRHGYVGECNDAMAHLAGVGSADDLVGTPFSELFSTTDKRVFEDLRSLVRSRYATARVQIMPLDASGKPLYRLRTHCGIVENGHLCRIWGTTRDITELKRAELAVEAAERRFREVLENIQLPALMIDVKGSITFCNDSLARLTGTSKTRFAGENWWDKIPSAQHRDAWIQHLASHSDAAPNFHIDCAIRSEDGSTPSVSWDTILLRDEHGETVGLAAIGRCEGPAS